MTPLNIFLNQSWNDFLFIGCHFVYKFQLQEILLNIYILAAGQAEAGMISKGKAKEKAEEGLQTLTLASAILQVQSYNTNYM